MGKTEILNAKITNTRLGKEYEYFTAELTIEGNSWRCVFGGCCLDRWSGYSFADGYGAIMFTINLNSLSWTEVYEINILLSVIMVPVVLLALSWTLIQVFGYDGEAKCDRSQCEFCPFPRCE